MTAGDSALRAAPRAGTRSVAVNQAHKRKADKAILQYVKACDKLVREVTQEFNAPLNSHMTYTYLEMIRLREGVYRRPPSRHVRLVRAEADALVNCFDLPRLYVTCECFLPAGDAAWLYIGVVWARAQIMRNVKRERDLSLLLGDEYDMPDHDDPALLRRAAELFWEQMMSDEGEGGNEVKPARVPFLRARAAGRLVARRNSVVG